LSRHVRFCKSVDGVRLAYASDGRGPAMVEVATWLNHLEHDWTSPVWGPRLRELSKQFALTRYDARGCGLSDRTVEHFSFEASLADLEAVVDAAGVERFALLGCCQGSGLAIAYAARHPDRVSHLILYGAFARGRMKRNPTLQDIDEIETMLKLVELGWGRDNPVFRQVYTSIFIPDSKPEQYRWFNDLQRLSTSPENAVQLIRSFETVDVGGLLPDVQSPTLVLHARNDQRVPFTEGRLVASAIAGAQFVALESRNHILLDHQPAWRQFFDEIAGFVRANGHAVRADSEVPEEFVALTARERDVLDRIARGLDNAQIATEFALSPKTVRNHINSIFGKLGTRNRAQAIVRARDAGLGASPRE
jgi:pimeloyl-ACP methyl ester carboxylesterase/DNA-binding CsgD family transcriptional regulator